MQLPVVWYYSAPWTENQHTGISGSFNADAIIDAVTADYNTSNSNSQQLKFGADASSIVRSSENATSLMASVAGTR